MEKMNELFPAIRVAPAEMICHPSRLSNTYEPDVERVLQPEITIPEQHMTVRIEKKTTNPGSDEAPSGYRPTVRKLLARFASRDALTDLGERAIYDARFVYNNNMTHLVQHHLSALGYVRGRLGLGPGDIVAILGSNPPPMASESLALAGYELVSTDGPVAGNVITVDDNLNHFFHLLAYVSQVDIGSRWISDTPRKVFIPRKGTRRLQNEDDLFAVLRGYGYEKVYFEEASIAEQWSIMRNATHIVGVHGAALGCMAFNAHGGSQRPLAVVELFGSGFVTNVFRKYVAVLGGRWIGCRGKITPEVVRDVDLPGKAKSHAFDDFELSPAAVELAITRLENSLEHL